MEWKLAKFKGLRFNTPQQKVFDILQVTTYNNSTEHISTKDCGRQSSYANDC
jgi:hypothetical protein